MHRSGFIKNIATMFMLFPCPHSNFSFPHATFMELIHNTKLEEHCPNLDKIYEKQTHTAQKYT